MAGGRELLKFVTQQVVTYIDTPKELRMERRGQQWKEPWQYRWFGMMPFVIKLWSDQLQSSDEAGEGIPTTPYLK